MQSFLYLFLAGFSMQVCISEKESNYYVVEMPDSSDDEFILRDRRQLSVYWNVPTMQCLSKKIPFDNLYENYGIMQNNHDRFRGEKITIFYDPGLFPALFSTSPGGYRFRNGGVPQEGSVQKHLDAFKISVEEAMPNKDFDGVAVIDFESWRPTFRQNFGVLVPYKNVSYDIERKEHWWWPKSWIESTAKERFERAAKIFMEATLSLAKKLRPQATWGYYGFPYCFNSASEKCSLQVNRENDGLSWLWSESTGVFPSIYSSKDLSTKELKAMVKGRIAEASRVRKNNAIILPYFWYRYRDGGYLKKEDLTAVLDVIQSSNASGLIIWGSSSDVNTVEKCENLLEYVTNTFGPAIAYYTKNDRKQGIEDFLENTQSTESLITTETTVFMTKLTTQLEKEASTEASTESSHNFNATQEIEKVFDIFETANKSNHDTLSGEVVLNSILQFFEMTDSNSTLNEHAEKSEFISNPDDTSGYSQNEIEHDLKPEVNSFSDSPETSTSLKRNNSVIPLPITSPFSKFIIAWKKNNMNISDTDSINPESNTDASVESSSLSIKSEETSTHSSLESIIMTSAPASTLDILTSTEIENDFIKDDIINTSIIIVSDPDKDSKEIFDSLKKLSSSVSVSSEEMTSTIKTTISDDDDDLLKAKQLLQNFEDSSENSFSSSTDSNKQQNYLNSLYDLGSIEKSSETTTVDENSKFITELSEDDMILEAVAEILNATEIPEVASS